LCQDSDLDGAAIQTRCCEHSISLSLCQEEALMVRCTVHCDDNYLCQLSRRSVMQSDVRQAVAKLAAAAAAAADNDVDTGADETD